MAAFFRISIVGMIWYAGIQSFAVFNQQDVRWFGFRWSISQSIDYVWNSIFDWAISTPSCSYCVWNRYRQNHRSISSEFPIVCMIWHAWIQSSAMFKQQNIRWCGFRWSIPLSIVYVWYTYTDVAISTPSCSYCMWDWYCQHHRSILPNFQLLAWFDALEFNHLPCSNSKMYDDAFFASRFRYQLSMFWKSIIDRAISTHSCSCCIWNR